MTSECATVLAVIVAVVVSAGCAEKTDGSAALSCELQHSFPKPGPHEIDILFVIDDSPAMKSKQEPLKSNLAHWVDVLGAVEGGLPSMHVGVVSADPAGGGVLQASPRLPGCRGPSGDFILDTWDDWEDCVDTDECGDSNYQGDLGDVLTCIAALGVAGASGQQPLAMLERALELDRMESLGFLRQDAFLLVVIVAAEDDTSAEDPVHYADMLRAFKANSGLIAIGLVASPQSTRLVDFGAQFPTRQSTASIDDDDWTDVFLQAAALLSFPLGAPCVDVRAVDRDPVQPGLQVDCSVSVAEFPDDPWAGPLIPACTMLSEDTVDPMTALPCWRMLDDGLCGPGSAYFLLEQRDRTLPLGAALRCACEP